MSDLVLFKNKQTNKRDFVNKEENSYHALFEALVGEIWKKKKAFVSLYFKLQSTQNSPLNI